MDSKINYTSMDSKINLKSIISSTSIWTLVARKHGARKTYDRLKDFNSIIASTSGLIAGFTFLVTNTRMDWRYEGYIGSDTRNDLFGVCLIVGLILSLISTLLATAIYGFINFIGPENDELFVYFMKRNHRVVGFPITLLNLSILVMLMGSSIAVGGLYSTWVYIVYVTIALVGFCLVGCYFWYNHTMLRQETKNFLLSLPEFLDTKQNELPL